MLISENGLNLIKKYEGCILQSYDDYNDSVVCTGGYVRGTLTIGYGHIEGVWKGQVITQQQAEDMLRNDMVKYCNQVDEVINEGTISFPVNQNMYDALVSFDYNCGQGSLRSLCRNRDKQTVADMLLEYRNKGSVWEQGLLRRRQEERSLFLSNAEGGVVISCGGGSLSSDPVSHAREFVGDRALELQQKLNRAFGYGLAEDGIIGQASYNAIVDAQGKLGVSQDGLFGEQSWGALENKLNQPQPSPTPQPCGEAKYWVGRIQQLCNAYGMNIAVDNLYGSETENAIRNLPLCGIPYTAPEATKFVQERIGAGVDGIFLNESAEKVGEWQRSHGLADDQIVGFNTYKSLALD